MTGAGGTERDRAHARDAAGVGDAREPRREAPQRGGEASERAPEPAGGTRAPRREAPPRGREASERAPEPAADARAPRVGVLSLQGDFACHAAALEAIGAEAVRVTLPRDLEGLDALVLPGGESTTMLRMMSASGLRAPLEAFVRERPVMGTCAGVILLAAEAGQLPAAPLGALDVTVERNAYGRQIDSFSASLESPAVGGVFPGVFIRAPRIRRVGEGVEVLAWRREGGEAQREPTSPSATATGRGEPVAVRSGKTVGLCFHPELTSDRRFHRWFLTAVAGLALPGGAAAAPAAPPQVEAA